MKSINWRGYRIITWVGEALLAIFVIFAALWT